MDTNDLESKLEKELENISKNITDKETFILDENKENLVREGVSLPKREADLVEQIRGRVTKSGFYPTTGCVADNGIRLAICSVFYVFLFPSSLRF